MPANATIMKGNGMKEKQDEHVLRKYPDQGLKKPTGVYRSLAIEMVRETFKK